ncbi:SHOCT domain-containing protein [Stieleria sp. TO1_6]|uniref:SHOCT domain-containing protein n=1 Tax=Stieleria tagensis TaxID=2956795 RepID=UPI00209B4809|nr:SHOCT domain-containing protein [Stieleria tagensis]MCO8124461.1 SHOCT domain-containing protein [Stieleria tagensis]
MPSLSSSGEQLVQSLASRYGLSTDAVTHMLVAVSNGNGSMAQFNHPEFCGAGQWMRGGMTMVSDLFNNNLKCLVNNLCSDISSELANHQTSPFSGSFQSQSQNGNTAQSQASGQMGSANSLFVPDPSSNWWPSELGSPSSLGSQNSLRYAYFANSHRLAVTTGGTPWVYDTLDHQINGFSQQQGGGQSITFTSQYGTVDLSTLPVVSRDGTAPLDPPAQPAPQTNQPAVNQPAVNQPESPSGNDSQPSNIPSAASVSEGGEDIIATLERLGSLKDKGYITEEEFASKKSELLGRL